MDVLGIHLWRRGSKHGSLLAKLLKPTKKDLLQIRTLSTLPLSLLSVRAAIVSLGLIKARTVERDYDFARRV